MRLVLFFNIIFFGFYGFLHSQNVQEDEFITNLRIYSKLMEKNLISLENQFILLGNNNLFCVKVDGVSEISEYFYMKLKQKFPNNKIIWESDCSNYDFIVDFNNINFKTKYIDIFGSILKNRKVKRRIEISYDCSIKKKNTDSLIYSKNMSNFNEDFFYLENIEDIERGGYGFLKGTLPNQGIWEKVFIPGLVTLSSAVTIVLFFIIRSK